MVSLIGYSQSPIINKDRRGGGPRGPQTAP